VLREAWPDTDAWPAGKSLHPGAGAFCDFTTLLATRHGHVRCFKYAVERGCSLHPRLLCESGSTPAQLDCFRYALELGLEVDAEAIRVACRNVNVKKLKLLIHAYDEQRKNRREEIEQGKRKREDVDDVFVDEGTLLICSVCTNATHVQPHAKEMIDILVARGCGLSERHTYRAIEKGTLDVLKHLVEKGCPWHEKALDIAKERGDAATIAFAQTHNRKVQQRKSLTTIFNVIELHKEQMMTQEYIDACQAAKTLHDSL